LVISNLYTKQLLGYCFGFGNELHFHEIEECWLTVNVIIIVCG